VTEPPTPPPYGRQDGPPSYGPPAEYGYQPEYDRPHGMTGFGQQPYGPAPYPLPGYPAPAWPPPEAPRRSRTLLVSLLAGGVVVLAAVGVVLWLVVGRGAGTVGRPATVASAGRTAPVPGGATVAGVPPAMVPPTGLGDDAVLNGYARDCYHGNMVSCDVMYVLAGRGTSYSVYGDTCAGRQPEGTDVQCEVAFPG
jgi:hypothetical protein